jgi:16S rRNA (guanine966-N2)-methyltransferase
VTKRASNSVRIIGGQWRGQRVHFPHGRDLRPTPDRQRETLFNWLGGDLPGAHCLDLFAGSGVLGLEALSRGAAHVTAVDISVPAIRALSATAHRLGAEARLTTVRAPVARFLEHSAFATDVVFIDPPYTRPKWVSQALARLHAHGWLARGATIYVELAEHVPTPEVPRNWSCLRSRRAGAAQALLYKVEHQC